MTDENIDLSRMANDAYCKLGAELDYYKERCRLAENILEVNAADPDLTPAMILAYHEYNTFINNIKNPSL